MQTRLDSLREEFEKRLEDLEGRITGVTGRGWKEGDRISVRRQIADLAESLRIAEGRARFLEQCLAQKEMEVARKKDLEEEVRFLKAEIEAVTVREGPDRDRELSRKDSEIARMFARVRELENENRSLRDRAAARHHDERESKRSRRASPRESPSREGLLGWLLSPAFETGKK